MADVKKVNNANDENLDELHMIRVQKLRDLQAEGNDPFVITKCDVTHHSADIKADFDNLDGKEVSVAGRLMSKRIMGKASFCNVQDLKGSIQSYVARDCIGEDEYKAFKKMDIGDIVNIKGTVFKTKTGEISIHATQVVLLSKSLQVLPRKVPRTYQYRYPLPPEIYRPYYESGRKGYICKAFKNNQQYQKLS